MLQICGHVGQRTMHARSGQQYPWLVDFEEQARHSSDLGLYVVTWSDVTSTQSWQPIVIFHLAVSLDIIPAHTNSADFNESPKNEVSEETLTSKATRQHCVCIHSHADMVRQLQL